MEMARIKNWVVWLVVLGAAGCAKSICPDGMTLDATRSKPGQSAFCQSASDKSRAAWIELSPGGAPSQPLQICPFLGGRPGGPYLAFHPSGARRLEGRYESGKKVGLWTQLAPDGRKVADGKYRDGQLIEGAPVGFQATCESVAW